MVIIHARAYSEDSELTIINDFNYNCMAER